MAGAPKTNNSEAKMMLGFIVRRCAAELGHAPSPDEFAEWANQQRQNGRTYCLFGTAISPSAAKVMFSQPSRLVTVREDGVVKKWNGNGG